MKNRVLVTILVVLLVGTFVFAAGSQETQERGGGSPIGIFLVAGCSLTLECI